MLLIFFNEFGKSPFSCLPNATKSAYARDHEPIPSIVLLTSLGPGSQISVSLRGEYCGFIDQ